MNLRIYQRMCFLIVPRVTECCSCTQRCVCVREMMAVAPFWLDGLRQEDPVCTGTTALTRGASSLKTYSQRARA